MMRIVVVGIGHVGLVTAAALAERGHRVIGMDDDRERVHRLRNGTMPFYEPDLQRLVERGVEGGRLRFDDHLAEALPGVDAVFICVGTPTRATGEASLVAVEAAARAVAAHLEGPAVIVEKSTVPAGTANRVRSILEHLRPDLAGDLEVVSNPEFLREGQAVEDALRPDRILVGASSERGFEAMRRVYDPFVRAGSQLIETDIATAEMGKHACNAFLALKISFANALARLCERAGADVTAIADIMGSDDRIGRQFLDAGLGWGGYCFPKDLQAFERLSRHLGYDFPLLREAARINEEAVDATVDKVRDAVWNIEDKRIALLGLSFKPGTDDVRFSPALLLARKLLDEDAHVVGYDPEAGHNAKSEMPGLEIAPGTFEAVDGADCVVVCTEWEEFRSIDLHRLAALMARPVLVDARNLFDPEAARAAGITYCGTGRATAPWA